MSILGAWATNTVKQQPDIRVENHGSICLLVAVSYDAHEWLVAHTPSDAMWARNDALVVEPRYVLDIINGAASDGLVVRRSH